MTISGEVPPPAGGLAAVESKRPTASVTNRREQAYLRLKGDIVEGRLRPGEPLGELEVAARLGVSRTPVREALQRLAVEGLVNWVPGRGAFVSSLSVPDIVELFQLREALESYTARLAARAPGHASLVDFDDQFEHARTIVKSGGDIGQYNRLTEEFDRAVVELAANRRVRLALEDVWAHASRVRRLSNRNLNRTLRSIDEHQKIARAIYNGHEDQAAIAAAEHIRNSLQNIIESLASSVPSR